jgi:hypothetical protein
MDLLIVLALAAAAAAPSAKAPAPTPALKPPIPAFDSTAFAARVDNPYFPLRPGTVFVYRTHDAKGSGTDTIEVTRQTRRILGVIAVVVRDRAYRDSVLIEDTYDWYAQDKAGSVWYLGEDTKAMRGDSVVSTAGSWEAGRDGAFAGVIMPGVPDDGLTYRQEYRAGVAEDMARIVSLSAQVKVMGETFSPCVVTEDWSPLERGVKEQKIYAPGLGLVFERTTAGGDEEMELVKVLGR